MRAVDSTELLVLTPTMTSVVSPRACSQRSSPVLTNASGTFFSTTCSRSSGTSAGWNSTPGCPGQNGEPGVREMWRTWTIGAPRARQDSRSSRITDSAPGLFRAPEAGQVMPTCMSMIRSVGMGGSMSAAARGGGDGATERRGDGATGRRGDGTIVARKSRDVPRRGRDGAT